MMPGERSASATEARSYPIRCVVKIQRVLTIDRGANRH